MMCAYAKRDSVFWDKRDTLLSKELRERTASKSLKLISKKWLGVEHYYKVECQVCPRIDDGFGHVTSDGFDALQGDGGAQCHLQHTDATGHQRTRHWHSVL